LNHGGFGEDLRHQLCGAPAAPAKIASLAGELPTKTREEEREKGEKEQGKQTKRERKKRKRRKEKGGKTMHERDHKLERCLGGLGCKVGSAGNGFLGEVADTLAAFP
jgi:hypothetical protein